MINLKLEETKLQAHRIYIQSEYHKKNAFLNRLPFFLFLCSQHCFHHFLIYYHFSLLLYNQFLTNTTMDRMSIETRVLVVKTNLTKVIQRLCDDFVSYSDSRAGRCSQSIINTIENSKDWFNCWFKKPRLG
jgi:hypothetical protein